MVASRRFKINALTFGLVQTGDTYRTFNEKTALEKEILYRVRKLRTFQVLFDALHDLLETDIRITFTTRFGTEISITNGHTNITKIEISYLKRLIRHFLFY